MFSFHRFVLALSLLLVVAVSGCSDVVEQLGTDTSSRVPHQSWGSYNLYQYSSGGWQLLVDLG